MEKRIPLTKEQLSAISYFVVGVSTEGNKAGRDVSSQLSFAGIWTETLMDPVANSGISIGTLQKDLGQDGMSTATALAEAYQAWARMDESRRTLTDDECTAMIRDLSRSGHAIDKEKGRPIDAGLKTRVNAFLASEQGKDFVHARDVAQVEKISRRALSPMRRTFVFEAASQEDQIVIATVVAKGFNQQEIAGGDVVKFMVKGKQARANEPTELLASEVLDYANTRFNKTMKEGREHALIGARLFTRLHSTPEGSPLHTAWQEVLRDPLIAPSAIGKDPERPDLAAHYTLIKNLFLEPRKAITFIDALEQGLAHAEGKVARSGFYTDGTHLVQWNADGKGVSYVDGQWAEVSRDALGLTRARDGSIDLARRDGDEGQPLLHIEPPVRTFAGDSVKHALRPGARGEDVRQLQEQLARLGYTDTEGRPLHADGDYGPGTRAAVRAFQREHDLVADGLSGRQTLASVRHALDERDASIVSAHRPHEEVMAIYRAVEPASPSVAAEPGAETRLADDGMAAYRSLEPATRSSGPLNLAADTPVARESTVGPPSSEAPTADATRLLQERLNALGITDADGLPLAVHGTYDMATRTAVARFQSAHGFSVTGRADTGVYEAVKYEAFIATLRDGSSPRSVAAAVETTIDESTRQPLDTAVASMGAPAAPAMASSSPVSATPSRLDPRHVDHPENDLYEALKERLPDASERRLLQSTAACHRSGITADNLSLVHINEETMTLHVFGDGPLTSPASVDLSHPSPAPEESLERMAQFDHQQTQMLAEVRSQQAQLAQGFSR